MMITESSWLVYDKFPRMALQHPDSIPTVTRMNIRTACKNLTNMKKETPDFIKELAFCKLMTSMLEDLEIVVSEPVEPPENWPKVSDLPNLNAYNDTEGEEISGTRVFRNVRELVPFFLATMKRFIQKPKEVAGTNNPHHCQKRVVGF